MSFVRRVVIDTGVLISAAICPDSVPALAFEKALLQFDICTSSETLAELETVLLRPKFDRYLPAELRREFLVGYCKSSTIMMVDLAVNDCIDPKDNKFLELAEAANAEIIIASDPHLTNLHPWREIPILPPAAFLIGVH
ncbi:MAG TPA: putative toxin-antitoxin system toxin component, PIN family [Gammaproteobacteria bacterium]|nr:putative toxin-antitoxin system toxin component, PIN family [Gammaproteobacteria bacterium]